MDDAVLAGIRVLEIGGGISAAFATRWMAGFGADVVRTEAMEQRLTPDEEVYLLPGKSRVAPDASQLRQLALAADIVVEDGRPGSLAKLGLEAATLCREKPELVITSITPFGQDGPYAAYDSTSLTEFAMGGIMSLTGSPDREPLVNGGSQAQYLGGLHAFGASLTAYYGAMVHGEGDCLDISLQEIQAGMLELYGPGSAVSGAPQMRMGNHVRAVWGIYPCADGYAGVCTLERQVRSLFQLVGDSSLQEERFQDPYQRAANDDELTAIMYGWFARFTKQEILDFSPIHKVPLGAVMTPSDLLASENLKERGFFDSVETPNGMARIPGRPFEGFPWRAGPLHEPGADTEAVLGEWLGVRA